MSLMLANIYVEIIVIKQVSYKGETRNFNHVVM